jgi:hypothetical protein
MVEIEQEKHDIFDNIPIFLFFFNFKIGIERPRQQFLFNFIQKIIAGEKKDNIF